MEHEHDTMGQERQVMVQTQLAQRGIRDEGVLRAMLRVPRHLFVPEEMCQFAYEDRALPIAEGQTISQPYIVALMAQALMLQGNERVLEVGTGTGYSAAVLSLLSAEVYSIDRMQSLADVAQARLHEQGYSNVFVHVGDGTSGLPECGPFDAISVAAASPWVPLPLRQQLAEGGRLVIPVGGHSEQMMLRLTKRDDTIYTERLGSVRFVPLLGEHSWK